MHEFLIRVADEMCEHESYCILHVWVKRKENPIISDAAIIYKAKNS